MRYRHIIALSGVCLPMCAVLRIIQLIFTIDTKTGFIKQQYSGISTVMTVVIFAGIASVGLISLAADGVVMQKKDFNPVLAVISFLAGAMFIYDTVTLASNMGRAVWYDMLSMLLGLLCAAVFIAFGVRKIYNYNFIDSLLIIPVFYYIIKLISVFVSTSELAPVTENIFLLFTNGTLLFFMFEFSKIENNIDEKPKIKKIFSSGIIASMLCIVHSVSKIAAGGAALSRHDISSALLTLTAGIFVLLYIVTDFGDKPTDKKVHTAKHLAE